MRPRARSDTAASSKRSFGVGGCGQNAVVDYDNRRGRRRIRPLPGGRVQVPPAAHGKSLRRGRARAAGVRRRDGGARARGPRSMRAWLFTVAERRLVDELRRRGRAARTADMLAPRADDAAPEPLGAVETALHRLPRCQRRIVVMRILEGRTYRDIARELGCNEAACKMRLSRALQRLRDDLALAS